MRRKLTYTLKIHYCQKFSFDIIIIIIKNNSNSIHWNRKNM